MLFCCFFSFALSIGAGTPENYLKITWQKCTKSGCTSQNGGIVADSEWRDVVDSNGQPCLHGNQWVSSICSDETACSKNCFFNGFNYSSIGVTTSGSSVRLPFLTPTGDIGSRLYLIDAETNNYVVFNPLNKEFTFDVDTSTVACGINGALYWVEMAADGGTSQYPLNEAGALYGTGYCDAQCPRDGKFIGGKANLRGSYGSCCFEWDIWEANAYATQFAGHPCDTTGPSVVCDENCQQCDTSGCAWNPFFKGDSQYYGPGLTIDTSKKFTVVTQFITDTGADNGNLKEIKRFYVQNGKVIPNNLRVEHDGNWSSMTQDYCDGPSYDNDYAKRGGHSAMTKSFRRGHVLAMSIWTDGSMWWLDSGEKGPCESQPGKDNLVAQNPNAYVEYSNIKFGDIDSTY